MTLADAIGQAPGKQVLLCTNEQQCEQAAALFPACVAVYPNGADDWPALGGRSVVAFSEQLAQAAAPHAAALKLIAVEIPTPPPRQPLAWAKAHARPYQPAPAQAQDGSRDLPPESPALPELGADPIQDAPQSRQSDAGPPPLSDSDFPPEASTQRPRKRAPRLQVVGNAALAPDPEAAPLPTAMSEDALADAFAEENCENWRYVKTWNQWFKYDGDGWRRDETEEIDRCAVELCRAAVHWPEAASLTPEGKRKIGQRRVAGAVRDQARHDRRIAATADQWDADPMMLGCPGGAIDLRTGKLIEGDREAYITLRTAVAPERGTPELWLAHLDKALQGDADTIGFLRRFLGYMLTGHVGEHCLVFFYGTGRNGKGTIVETVIKLMGDYGYAAPMNLLMESKSERHPTELAALRGRRAVSASEPPEGARWDDGRIRFLTGGDTINARGMRQDPFTFEPTHKLLLMGNNMPSLRSVDAAIEARFKMIEFNYFFRPEERDPHFPERLRAEWPQKLHWMIEGCIEYQDAGLGMPEGMERATSEYLQSEDTFLDWLTECTDAVPGVSTKSSEAYANYKRWCETQGSGIPSHKAFAKKLLKRGFKLRKSGARFVEGLRMKLPA